ncbi:MAG: PQQ-binding-like beta-propeller repeat protein [Candidatus Eremiobacteraeota bacterium]|nr:PQQ-binding-like beta-propeller repeat protein [Candidatus Eremiobacteraeota bacterium]
MEMNRVNGSFSPGYAALNQGTGLPEAKEEKEAAAFSDGGDQVAPAYPHESIPQLSPMAGSPSIDMTKAAQALSKTNTVLWEFSHKGDMVQDPLIAEGAIYISAFTDGLIGKTLYALDAKTGDRMWEIKEKERTSGFAVQDGVCYYGSEAEKKLFALDAKTGSKLWEFQAPDGMISDPVVHDGVVYAGDYRRNLHAIDTKTGEELWSFKTRGTVTGRPVVSDGVLYVGCHGKSDMDGGAIYALSLKKKGLRGLLTRVLWKERPEGYHGMDMTVRNDTLYLSTEDGNILALDKKNGSERWKSKPWEEGQKLVVYPAPIVAGNELFCSRVDGTLFSLNAETGEKLWQAPLPGNIHKTPQERKGIIYIGCADQKIHAIDGKTGKELTTYSASGRLDPSFSLGSDAIYTSHGGKLSANLLPDAVPDAAHIAEEIENEPVPEKGSLEEIDGMLSVDGIRLKVRQERE